MALNLHQYEGTIHDLKRVYNPDEHVEFSLHGHDVLFIAGPQYMESLRTGDRVWVACQIDEDGDAIVLGLLKCTPGEGINEGIKKNLLGWYASLHGATGDGGRW